MTVASIVHLEIAEMAFHAVKFISFTGGPIPLSDRIFEQYKPL